MRFDDEHAYDQKIYDIDTIRTHLIPEHKYRKMVLELSKKQGTITGAYWLIDVVCALNPKEMSEERKNALKKLTMKIYTAYDDLPDNKTMVGVMKAAGYKINKIAETLNISRNSVYYFLERTAELPTRCMLTYGEYNLMSDFMDLWHELGNMEEL